MKQKIFLIEDDAAIIDVYSIAFNVAGIHFDAISSGKEALRKIQSVQDNKEEKPSLILLDLMLPDANGLDLLFQIRNHSATKDVPVFILSNYSSKDLKNINYIKANRYILKSEITPTQLAKLVLEQLKEKA